MTNLCNGISNRDFAFEEAPRANVAPVGLADAAAVELAVAFLEADPQFADAADMKESVAACLARVELSPDHRNRVAALLLRSLRHGTERMFRRYVQLAPRVSTPLLRAAITCYAATCEQPVGERARRVLEMLDADAWG